MPQRLRFLLDTNVLIPLQDSYQVLESNLANFVRLANVGGHQLLRSGPANLNNAISGNSGHNAGPRPVWQQGVFDEEEGIGSAHPPHPQS
ncbi:MAG: hypothetical protein ACK52V_14915, partial [Betaproteobacteria bacterium]